MGFRNEIDDSDLLSNPLFQIYDLSFIELIILNTLINTDGRILRHDLYKEVNGLVKSYKKISTSSFYNSLEKLRDRGFVDFVKSENVNYRKAIEVYSTESAKEVLGFLFYFLIQFNAGIVEFLEINLKDKIIELTGINHFERTIVIEPTTTTPLDLLTSIVPFTVDTIKSMAMISRNIYLLSTDQLFEKFLQEGLTDITRSNVMEGESIREPNEAFDLILFPLYRRNISFKGLNYSQILNEAKRLLKINGYLLIIHLEELPTVDHYFLEVFRKYLALTDYFVPHTSEDVKKDLESIGFAIQNVFDNKGVNFLLATKI